MIFLGLHEVKERDIPIAVIINDRTNFLRITILFSRIRLKVENNIACFYKKQRCHLILFEFSLVFEKSPLKIDTINPKYSGSLL